MFRAIKVYELKFPGKHKNSKNGQPSILQRIKAIYFRVEKRKFDTKILYGTKKLRYEF